MSSNFSTLEKMSLTQVQDSLSSVTYADAVNHYNNLKESFFKQYSIAAQKSVAELEEFFKEEIIAEINNEPVSKQEKLADKLFEQIGNEVIKGMQGLTPNLSNLRNAFQVQAEQKGKEAKNNYQRALNSVLNEEVMRDMIITMLKESGYYKKGVSINDILNQVRGYRNKAIFLEKPTMKKNYKYYKTSTKGFIREAMVYKAFSKLSEHLNGKTVVIHAGDMKNAAGKDTIFDGFLDFFNNIEGSFNISVNEDADAALGTGFGFQSKSWIAPWEKGGFKRSFGISGQAGLLKSFEGSSSLETYSWIHGVLFLQNHIIDAMGREQLAYITGNTFYWTADLIANFRQMQYYYAFVFDKDTHKATSRTAWEQINMDA